MRVLDRLTSRDPVAALLVMCLDGRGGVSPVMVSSSPLPSESAAAADARDVCGQVREGGGMQLLMDRLKDIRLIFF
jgi:hypothetical protein